MGKSKIGFLFDLDGVIIDSESEYTRIWNHIDSVVPSGIKDYARHIKGCTLSKILTDNYPDEKTRNKVKDLLHELESKMQYRYLPYAKEFLQALKNEGLPCVLVTSSDNKKMQNLFSQLPEITGFFNDIITGDRVKTSKPSPEGYLLGAEIIYRNPQNCVVFEDSLQGVMAGKSAGCYVTGVKGTIEEDKLRPFSHKLIENMGEINLPDLIRILEER